MSSGGRAAHGDATLSRLRPRSVPSALMLAFRARGFEMGVANEAVALFIPQPEGEGFEAA